MSAPTNTFLMSPSDFLTPITCCFAINKDRSINGQGATIHNNTRMTHTEEKQ